MKNNRASFFFISEVIFASQGYFYNKWPQIGDRKSLSIAKSHWKPSQEFSEQFGPSIQKMKGFLVGVHPEKFTRTSPKTWEDKFLGIP